MILELAQSFLASNPTIATILQIVGGLRIFCKPIFSFAKFISSKTKTTRDDEFIQKLEESKVYTILRFGLDWMASVKLPESGKK